MAIKAEIVADSINPRGCRLTTFVLEYPRFVHSELLTHRMFSKNAASSRAIPIEKMIGAVQTNPAMPVWWGKNQSGMQANEELDDIERKERRFNNGDSEATILEYFGIKGRYIRYNDFSQTRSYLLTDREAAKIEWLLSRDRAVMFVRKMNGLGLHKQIANRILEPWFHMRIILSGTEFGNFFALRAHPDAQPEFQALAYKMLEAYNASEPKKLAPGEWHVPFGDKINDDRLADTCWDLIYSKTHQYMPNWEDYKDQFFEFQRKIAIARCARISYLNYEGKDDYAADIKLCDRLFGTTPKHLSPTEHVARCEDHSEYVGNFKGWTQFRKTVADENLTDSRILQK